MCSSLAKPSCPAKKDSDSSLSSLHWASRCWSLQLAFPAKSLWVQGNAVYFRPYSICLGFCWTLPRPFPFQSSPSPSFWDPKVSILPSLKAFLTTSSWHFLLPLCRSCFLALNSTRRVRSGSLTLPGSWGFALIHHVIWRFPRGKGLEWFPHQCQCRFLFLSSQTYLSSQQNPSSPQIQWRHCLFSSVWGAGASPSSPVGLFFLQLLCDCILGCIALVTR